MIRKFNVTVNGNQYQVEVEEVKENASPSKAPLQTKPAEPIVATKQPVQQAPQTEQSQAAQPQGGSVVSAPMPGTILSVAVNVGDSVQAGQLAVVLEAMKMENELTFTTSGVVKEVNVSKGSSVNTGDTLIVTQ